MTTSLFYTTRSSGSYWYPMVRRKRKDPNYLAKGETYVRSNCYKKLGPVNKSHKMKMSALSSLSLSLILALGTPEHALTTVS